MTMNPKEVKFRGKSKHTGEWLYGDLVRNVEGAFAIVPPFEMTTDNLCDRYEVDDETVGQFTGLLDKNGKEIYEGDVVKQEYIDDDTNIATIVWNNGSAEFLLKNAGKNCYWLINGVEIEIIGNIYDNKYLLEQND